MSPAAPRTGSTGVAHGSVIDFINVGFGPIRTGIFNVADVAIMLGVSIIVVAELRRGAPGQPLPRASSDCAESRDAGTQSV